MFTAPKPIAWNAVYERLLGHLRRTDPQGHDVPPVPLILGGRIHSSSRDKHERWLATLAWAERHACADLAQLPASDFEHWDRNVPGATYDDVALDDDQAAA